MGENINYREESMFVDGIFLSFLDYCFIFVPKLNRKTYLLIVYFQIRSLDHKGCVVLPGLELLEEVDEGPEDQPVVLVHRAPAHHLLKTERLAGHS